jgi:hypothetical protein
MGNTAIFSIFPVKGIVAAAFDLDKYKPLGGTLAGPCGHVRSELCRLELAGYKCFTRKDRKIVVGVHDVPPDATAS